jgi:hypothetical protein
MKSMSLDTTVTNFRKEYARLRGLIDKYSSPNKPLPLFITHYEYIYSLTTSILVLSKNPKDNVIALVSLLRMLLESVAVLYELVNGDENHQDRASFVRSYQRGKQYPEGMSYRILVSRLPSRDKDVSKVLKKLYDECSKATHFSKKSLDILIDIKDPMIAVQWSGTLIELVSDSYKQQSDTIEQLVATKMK